MGEHSFSLPSYSTLGKHDLVSFGLSFNMSFREVIQCLDNIPGLSEHFLFANDDMFFDKNVFPNYFFTSTGKNIIYLKKHNEWDNKLLTENCYCCTIYKSAKLIDDMFLTCECNHNICAYTKNNLNNCKKEFKELFDKTTLSKFRSFDNIQRHIYDFWAIKNNRANALFFKNKKKTHQLYLNVSSFEYMKRRLKKYKPFLVCYNDMENVSTKDRKNLKVFLNNRYTQKQEWELF